jgi:hypothetical protein
MKLKLAKGNKRGKTVKDLTIAAGIAMKNGFYTEAVWLISAIMEIRLKKIVIITETANPGSAMDLEHLLKRIKLLQSRPANSLLSEHFPAQLIQSMREWKNNRNIMMKDMLEMHVSQDRKERLASQGVHLLKDLSRTYKHYKLAAGELHARAQAAVHDADAPRQAGHQVKEDKPL